MFEYYQEHNTEIERHTLEDFAQSSTSHSDGSIRSNLKSCTHSSYPTVAFWVTRGFCTCSPTGFRLVVEKNKNFIWKTSNIQLEDFKSKQTTSLRGFFFSLSGTMQRVYVPLQKVQHAIIRASVVHSWNNVANMFHWCMHAEIRWKNWVKIRKKGFEEGNSFCVRAATIFFRIVQWIQCQKIHLQQQIDYLTKDK